MILLLILIKSWSTTFYPSANCSPYYVCGAADFCSDYHSAVLICSPGPVAWWSQCLTIILLRMTWILVWALCEQWWGCEHSVNILPHKCVMDLIRTNMGLFKPTLEHWHAFGVLFCLFFSPRVLLRFFSVVLLVILLTGCFLCLLLTIQKHWAGKQRHHTKAEKSNHYLWVQQVIKKCWGEIHFTWRSEDAAIESFKGKRQKSHVTVKWRGSGSRLRYTAAALFPRFQWRWIPETGKPVFLCCHNILPLGIWLIVFFLLKHCDSILSNNIEKSFRAKHTAEVINTEWLVT